MRQCESYNGWKNHQTWTISLWLNNDEGLYNIMREHARRGHDYAQLASFLSEICPEGVDDTGWMDSALDHDELNEMMKESIDGEA